MDKVQDREPRPPLKESAEPRLEEEIEKTRKQTDASLTTERTKVDDTPVIEFRALDTAREALRKSADRTLSAVREEDDKLLSRQPQPHPEHLSAAVQRERSVQDQLRHIERAGEDSALQQERDERARIKTEEVSEQRKATDQSLEQERADTDLSMGESELSFRLLVEQSRDYAIFMLDPHGHVVSWNEGAERLKGYRFDEIIGKHFSIFYTHEDLKLGKPQEHLRRATLEGRVEVEGWRVRKDGSTFMANMIITPFRDQKGDHRGFVKFTRDITERVTSAERELAQAQENLRLVNQHVATIASFHTKEENRLDTHQRRAEWFTGQVGRPRSLYLFLLVVIAWVAFNGLAASRGWTVLDPLPCFFLQGLVAAYATLMTTVILITQTRQQKYAEQRAYLELQLNLASEQKTAKVIGLIEELRRDLPIVRNRIDHQAAAMAQSADPQAILAALEETLHAPAKKA